MRCDDLFEKEGCCVGVTKRQSLIADIASVEGCLGRTRGAFTDGGDLMVAATELEQEAEALLKIASEMGTISREALRTALDQPR